MSFSAACRALLYVGSFLPAVLFAQEPFHFPTANHYLFVPGEESKFFAPTTPDKPWTSGSFGCVRDDRQRIHEGLDILHLHTNKYGEPTDPILATADGTVMFFNDRPALSNFGNYIILRHVIDGMQIYSLYGHLSRIAPGLHIGQHVQAGEAIGTMGRTANNTHIAKWRAHVHFQLNLLLNNRFAAWFKKSYPREHNYFGEWNGFNFNGLNVRQILLDEHAEGARFNLLKFIRNQTELCRVIVRVTNFSFLKRYPMLIVPNPVAKKEGVAGYEIALNFNATPFQLMPLAASQIKGREKFQLVSVNVADERANPCRHLVALRHGHWELAPDGLRALELLTY